MIDEVVVALRTGEVLLQRIEEGLEAMLAAVDVCGSGRSTLTSCRTAGATPPRRAMSCPRFATACACVSWAISWPYLLCA